MPDGIAGDAPTVQRREHLRLDPGRNPSRLRASAEGRTGVLPTRPRPTLASIELML
jgi:hypothetical protein